MTRIQFEGAALYASEQSRTVSGLLLPFDEIGATNQGRVSVRASAVPDPEDISILAVNVEHDQLRPAARFTTLTRMATGFYCSLAVGVGAAGDALLASIRDGSLGRLSVELTDVVIQAGEVVSARLTGGAFVARGAFPSAAILAAEHPDVDPEVDDEVDDEGDGDGGDDEGTETVEVFTDEFTDEDGKTWSRKSTTTTRKVGTDTTTTTVVELHEPDDSTDEETTVPKPTVPASIAASMTPLAPAGASAQPASTLPALFAALAQARETRSSTPLDAFLETAPQAASLFAALTDIKFDAAGGLAPTMTQPTWLGELWQARRVQRRIIPLMGRGTLTGMKAVGWKWLVRPKMEKYAGNKTAVPSNAATVDGYEVEAQGFAGAHDIDIRFRHFNVPGFWEGYFQSMTDSYAQLTDAEMFAALVEAATDVEPGAIPDGVPRALGYIVDGALAYIDDALPTYALVSKDLWRELILTKHDDRLAYLDAAFNLESGALREQSFKIVPAALPADTVIVGVQQAAEWHELGETPIRVEGLDLVKGGVDPACFGYGAAVIHDARAISKVTGTAPAPGGGQ